VDGQAGASKLHGDGSKESNEFPAQRQRSEMAEQRRYLVSSLHVDQSSFERSYVRPHVWNNCDTYHYDITMTMGSSITCTVRGDRAHPTPGSLVPGTIATIPAGPPIGAPFSMARRAEQEWISYHSSLQCGPDDDCDTWAVYADCYWDLPRGTTHSWRRFYLLSCRHNSR
jgi:hypothetical protein